MRQKDIKNEPRLEKKVSLTLLSYFDSTTVHAKQFKFFWGMSIARANSERSETMRVVPPELSLSAYTLSTLFVCRGSSIIDTFLFFIPLLILLFLPGSRKNSSEELSNFILDLT